MPRRLLPALFGATLLATASPASPSGPGAPTATSSASSGAGVTFGTKTSVPSAKEWEAATVVPLSRTSPAGKRCVARAVREWLRVRCMQKTFALSLLGGSNDGLSFWIAPADLEPYGEVQLPVRVGDRRVVQLWVQGSEKDAAPQPGVVLQEQWLEGEAAPKISVL